MMNTILAIVGATAGPLVGIAGLFFRRKLEKIHVLVNSRLDEALREIEKLKKSRLEVTKAAQEVVAAALPGTETAAKVAATPISDSVATSAAISAAAKEIKKNGNGNGTNGTA